MEKFTSCKCIFSSATALLDYVWGSDDQSTINSYMIHSHQFQSSKPTSAFWELQTSIVTQLHTICSLSLFVSFVNPDHDSRSILCFIKDLSRTWWVNCLPTWITPIMAIKLLDTLPLLSASTTLLIHQWKSSNSKLHPENYHYLLIHSFGGTSTKRSLRSPMDVRMMTLKRNHEQDSSHPFHLSRYLPPYRTASNRCTSFTLMVQTPWY